MSDDRADADRDEAMRDGAGLRASADGLATQVEQLQTKLVIQESVNQRQRRVGRVVVAVLIVVLLVVAGLGFLYASQRSFTHCLQTWADKSTSRSNALTPARATLDDTLDALIRTVGEPPEKAKADFPAAYADYIAASNHYSAVKAKHPVPKSPKLAC